VDENIVIDHYLDLSGIVCPVNFVKCCLALEKLSLNQVLKVDIDSGESEISVLDGLKEKGYKVKILKRDSKKVTLIISCEQI
tara:strand:+ start:349 stop:594 length:246 start_codon:yes stop_codon:yes gene_type:complete